MSSTPTPTLAAPSLEELPPQKGSILELHSINNSDFDGLIVEFVSIDKETGKYLVTSLKDGQNMFVKPRLCRRPDLKPLEFRKFLTGLADDILLRSDGVDTMSAYEAVERQLKGLLEHDPCCAPAYLFAGAIGREVPDKPRKECMRDLRRGLAILYGYQELLPEELVHQLTMILSTELWEGQRFKSLVQVHDQAMRRQFDSSGSTSSEQFAVSYACREFYSAEKLHTSVSKHFIRNKDSVPMDKIKESLGKYFKCLHAIANIKSDRGAIPESSNNEFDHEGPKHLDDIIRRSVLSVIGIVGCLLAAASVAVGYEAGQMADASDSIDEDHIKYCITMLHRAIQTVNSLLKACTTEDGTFKAFLDDSQRKEVEEMRSKAWTLIDEHKHLVGDEDEQALAEAVLAEPFYIPEDISSD